jgi:hypothetical protein
MPRSSRERAVCARALAGQTVHGVAWELGIKPPARSQPYLIVLLTMLETELVPPALL